MQLNFVFADGVPDYVQAAYNQVAAVFSESVKSDVDVTIQADYAVLPSANAVAKSNAPYVTVDFDTLKTAMLNASAVSAKAAGTLPDLDPIQTGDTPNAYHITVAQARVLGIPTDGVDSQFDGTVTINAARSWNADPTATPATAFDIYGAIAHEVTEVLGRIGTPESTTADGAPLRGVLDLFRYNGTTGAQDDTRAPGNYFSIDNGATDLVTFNNQSTGDAGDWSTTQPYATKNDAFGGATAGQPSYLSHADLVATRLTGLVVSKKLSTRLAALSDAAYANLAGNGTDAQSLATMLGPVASTGLDTGLGAAYQAAADFIAPPAVRDLAAQIHDHGMAGHTDFTQAASLLGTDSVSAPERSDLHRPGHLHSFIFG